MKINNKVRRITSVCAAAAVLVISSALPFSASADVVDDLSIRVESYLYNPNNNNIYTTVFNTIDNYQTYWEESVAESIPMDYSTRLAFDLSFKKSNGGILVKAGRPFNVNARGLSFGCYFDGMYFTAYKWDYSNYVIQLNYSDGTNGLHTSGFSLIYNPTEETFSISFDHVAEKDVDSIRIYQSIRQYDITGMRGVVFASSEIGRPNEPIAIEVDVVTKSESALEDIGDKIDSGLTDVGDKIDTGFSDVMNGTTQQNQQAQDAVGGLNNSADKLDDLGDQLASVEKPSFDNSNISADSLVPDTSLVVLASPFQALWENNQLLAMLTIVVTVVLISWVFFGKKA